MSTRSALRYGHHSRFGPPIIADDLATEREKLIAANQAFAAALKQALRSGGETSAAVLATVSPKRGKTRSLAL
jgi:hypothetical protein